MSDESDANALSGKVVMTMPPREGYYQGRTLLVDLRSADYRDHLTTLAKAHHLSKAEFVRQVLMALAPDDDELDAAWRRACERYQLSRLELLALALAPILFPLPTLHPIPPPPIMLSDALAEHQQLLAQTMDTAGDLLRLLQDCHYRAQRRCQGDHHSTAPPRL